MATAMAVKSTARTVLTYSLLMRMALDLRMRDATAFSSLTTGRGTEAMVRGLIVKWVLRNNTSRFELYYERKRRMKAWHRLPLAFVYGNPRGGKMYSYFDMKLMPTTPPTLIEKYLPIHLIGGRIHGWKTCSYTNFKATNADGSLSDRSGEWSVRKGKGASPGYPSMAMAIDDSTGKFVSKSESDQWNFGSWNRNGYCDTGVVPHSSISKTEWLKSVASMPGIDQRLTIECALRCAKAAMELTAEFPAIRAVYLPARESIPETGAITNDQSGFRLDGSVRHCVALGFEGTTPCRYWYMPEIVLFWAEGQPTVSQTDWASISIVVPPHGNSELTSTGDYKSPAMAHVLRNSERAHQTLRAFKPGCGVGHGCAKWEEHRDRAWVRLFSGEKTPMMPTAYPLAMKPGDLKDMVHGKFTIDSLPML